MPLVRNLYRKQTPNIGDRCCAPMLYYAIPGHSSTLEEINDCPIRSHAGDVLVVGGGGVFNTHGINLVQRAANCSSKHKILWGCGLNGASPSRVLNIIRLFDLVGMREAGFQELAPCASCKSPEFDSPPKATTDFVIYDHRERRVPVDGFPRMSNAAETMSDAIRFLSSGEIVLTNSYHGAYWSMLLGRKTLVFHEDFPHETTKLVTMLFRPALVTRENWREAARKTLKIDGFLGWCRYRSDRFYAKVADLCTA